ncbi:MAG TPA: PemK family transcriptional regulator [Blastocatellia bacterium]|nr:PemK family transcriptional regulator [Blastocatellia bacterium]
MSPTRLSKNAKVGRVVTLSSTRLPKPERGDVWLVNFDPTLGSEIRKTRPAVIISADAVGRLPVKLVAPITDWKEHYAVNIWHVRVDPTPDNGLTKTSAVDSLQIRGMDLQRFIRKLGRVSATTLEEIVLSIAAVIEYV